MHSYAQPRTLPAAALLYVAAVLRAAADRASAAARRVDTRIAGTPTPASCGPRARSYREFDGLAHLDIHVLKDIGAPHWLVARAAGELQRERVRWIALEHR